MIVFKSKYYGESYDVNFTAETLSLVGERYSEWTVYRSEFIHASPANSDLSPPQKYHLTTIQTTPSSHLSVISQDCCRVNKCGLKHLFCCSWMWFIKIQILILLMYLKHNKKAHIVHWDIHLPFFFCSCPWQRIHTGCKLGYWMSFIYLCIATYCLTMPAVSSRCSALIKCQVFFHSSPSPNFCFPVTSTLQLIFVDVSFQLSTWCLGDIEEPAPNYLGERV